MRLSSQRRIRVAAMKLLLGSLLLAGIYWLGAATNFRPMANFNMQRIAGTWYPLANIVIELQAPLYTLKVIPGRALTYSYQFRINGRCTPKELKFIEQETVGEFKTLSTVFIQMLDTDYKTYTISYVERGMDAFLTLAGKQSILTEGLREKFRAYATAAGVTGQIRRVLQRVTC